MRQYVTVIDIVIGIGVLHKAGELICVSLKKEAGEKTGK
jgi:hypothetical protein